jgi:hypothetical protein
VTLEAGTYHVWCPVPGHAAKGMKAIIVVSGGLASGGGSTSTASTSTGGSNWG